MHPTSSAAEIKRHVALTRCRVLFACRSLLATTSEVFNEDSTIYILDLPEELAKPPVLPSGGHRTVQQLIEEGLLLPELEPLRWAPGQAKEQVAYLCPTSGTSGLQVAGILRTLQC